MREDEPELKFPCLGLFSGRLHRALQRSLKCTTQDIHPSEANSTEDTGCQSVSIRKESKNRKEPTLKTHEKTFTFSNVVASLQDGLLIFLLFCSLSSNLSPLSPTFLFFLLFRAQRKIGIPGFHSFCVEQDQFADNCSYECETWTVKKAER